MKNDLRQGAIYAVTAAAAFAVTGACVKQAAFTASNEIIVFFRCALSLVFLLPWALKRGGAALKTTRPWSHLLRAVLGCTAMYCFFYTIAHMHLAEAMLLTYSTPLFIPFIAWIWIAEKPAAIAWAASALGLAGIALIVKPGDFEAQWQVGLVGVASGVFAACAMVNIRRISDTEPPERVVFYFAALGTAISTVPLLWAWRTPEGLEWPLLLGAGLFATIGQLNLTRAYACAPAARVGPFTYVTVPLTAVMAWVLWNETMDAWSVIGALVVISSCVLAGWQRKEPRLEE